MGAAELLSAEPADSFCEGRANLAPSFLPLGQSAAKFPLMIMCAYVPLGGNGSYWWELTNGWNN